MKFLYNQTEISKTRTFCYQYTNNNFRIVKLKNCRLPGFELLSKVLDDNINTKDEIERVSLSRTKKNIRELALCNDFEYFATLTVNKNYCDRYDIDICQDSLKKLFKAYKRKNKNFAYLFITEKHKDGAFHFHGLVKGMNAEDLYNNQNNYLSNKFFDCLGFNSFSVIRDYEKTCNYITKYITKDCVRNKTRQIYISSRGLLKAFKTEIQNFDDNSFFTFENDYCFVRDFKLSDLNISQLCDLTQKIVDK